MSRVAWSVALAFLMLRLGVLLTGVQGVSEEEELGRGTIAWELLQGLNVPFWDYQSDAYYGGALVIGLLAAPLFAWLGPNLFALKLVPLAFALATLGLAMALLRRYVSARAALFFGALVVLCPSVFTALSLITNGSHAESLAISVLLFWWFYRYLERGRTSDLLGMGLTGGLGFWFIPTTLVTFLTCLVNWLLLDRRTFLSRRLVVAATAFGAGALPWLFYDAAHGWQGVGFLRAISPLASLDHSGLTGIAARLMTLLTETLPWSFRFRPWAGFSSDLLTGLYGAGVAVVVGYALLAQRRALVNRRSLPLLLWPVLLLVIYGAGRLPVAPPVFPYIFDDFRYFAPWYLAVFIVLAIALDALRRPWAWLAFFLTLGVAGQGSLLAQEPFGRALAYQGSSYRILGEMWSHTVAPSLEDLPRFHQWARRFKEPDRRFLYLGWSLIWRERPPDPARMLAFLEAPSVPAPCRRYLVEGWGYALGQEAPAAFERLLALAPEFDQPYLAYGYASSSVAKGRRFSGPPGALGQSSADAFLFGLGRSFPAWFHAPGQLVPAADVRRMADRLTLRQRQWFYRGLGQELSGAWLYVDLPAAWPALGPHLPVEDQKDLAWGMGWGIRFELIEDRRRALDLLHQLPAAIRPWADQGVRACESWYGVAS